jgi:hypothetical protein
MIEEYLSKKILAFRMRIPLLHIFLVILLLIISIGYASGTPPEEEWNKTYRGANFNVQAVRQTHDGGYIIAGLKDSCSKNSFDFWLIKLEGKQMINEEEPIQSKEIAIHTEDISQSMNNSSHTPNITGFEFFYSISSILSMGYFLYYRKSPSRRN